MNNSCSILLTLKFILLTVQMFPALEKTYSEVPDGWDSQDLSSKPCNHRIFACIDPPKVQNVQFFRLVHHQAICLPPLLRFPLQLIFPFVCICCSIPLCVIIVQQSSHKLSESKKSASSIFWDEVWGLCQ